jgi:hypothetical protein
MKPFNKDSRVYLAQTMLNAIKQNNGCSINASGNVPTSGYMVSIAGHEHTILKDNLTFEACHEFILKNPFLFTDDNYFFGAWVDGDNVVFDLSANYLYENEARQAGIDHNQRAIWDVENSKEIFI